MAVIPEREPSGLVQLIDNNDNDVLGEVVAVPTTYTVLSRLRAIENAIGGSGTDVAAIAAVQGTVTDAAIVTDADGTISGKLRGLVTLFAARIATLGQKIMAASQPVVIASDQATFPVTTGGLTDTELRVAAVPVSTDAPVTLLCGQKTCAALATAEALAANTPLLVGVTVQALVTNTGTVNIRAASSLMWR